MTTPLERTYGRLLRLYPPAFRRERGPEMLGTLLDMADDAGRSWPAPREVVAIVLGALRMRAGRHPGASARDDRLTAIRVGALLLIVQGCTDPLVSLAADAVHRIPGDRHPAATLGGAVLGMIALLLAVRGRHLAAAIGLLPAGLGGRWQFLVAAVLLVMLFGHRPLPATGLLRYAPLVPLPLPLLAELSGQAFPQIAGILRFGFWAALAGAALLWVAVDERVTMAVGVLYLGGLIIQIGYVAAEGVHNYAWAALDLGLTALPAAMLLGSAGEAAHRRAKL